MWSFRAFSRLAGRLFLGRQHFLHPLFARANPYAFGFYDKARSRAGQGRP